jgi:intracellular sulfur oxidation DsrE/DsrF family protein
MQLAHAHSFFNLTRYATGILVSSLFLASILFAAPLHAADEELKFPGEDPTHKIIYHFNKADEEYHLAVLNTVRNMLRKYGDDITIVVSVMGPGIHLLLKEPVKPVSKVARDQAESLAFYGVKFHACGNTLKALNKTDKDVVDYASIVEVGVSDLLEHQQKGYAYISW